MSNNFGVYLLKLAMKILNFGSIAMLILKIIFFKYPKYICYVDILCNFELIIFSLEVKQAKQLIYYNSTDFY